MANESVPVNPYDFITLAKRAGFPYEKLAKLFAYSQTASGLDVTYSKRFTYDGDPPVRVLFAGPLALPVSSALNTTRKLVTNPSTAFAKAYELSGGGNKWWYLPPINEDELFGNLHLAQGYYAVWLTRQNTQVEEIPDGD
jgi:hypothetical protein